MDDKPLDPDPEMHTTRELLAVIADLRSERDMAVEQIKWIGGTFKERAQVVEAENARLLAVVDLARQVADDIDRAASQGRVIGIPVSVRELREALAVLDRQETT